ncbi:copper transport protein ATX1 [Gossypium hirsutum]|uniref:Copper transport protein ATX1 n=7 Tax=Gossypium TaxID=3633 RepID=A0A1U8KZG3_GOSHI|nr:copper transport protein ATX1 [Gossypium hirsutum]
MDAHVAEAIIMRKALSWIKDSNCDQIVIELDCMEVFNALGQASSRVSEFGLVLNDCTKLKDRCAMSQTVVLKVGMSCEGCVGAVKRVLGKMEGVESYEVDLKEQKVTVKGQVQPDAVLQTVSKTGKKTTFWDA